MIPACGSRELGGLVALYLTETTYSDNPNNVLTNDVLLEPPATHIFRWDHSLRPMEVYVAVMLILITIQAIKPTARLGHGNVVVPL